MSDQGHHLDEEKLLTLANAKLDARLKEAELAQKTKPWRSLANPTTLMAIITGLATLQSGLLSYFQAERQTFFQEFALRGGGIDKDSRELGSGLITATR